MVDEQTRPATVSRGLLNHLTILLPTLEGLCQITVADGKKGWIHFRYAPDTAAEMEQFWAYLAEKHGSEFQLGVFVGEDDGCSA